MTDDEVAYRVLRSVIVVIFLVFSIYCGVRVVEIVNASEPTSCTTMKGNE